MLRSAELVVLLLCEVPVDDTLLIEVQRDSDHALIEQEVCHLDAALLLDLLREQLGTRHLDEKDDLLRYQLAVDIVQVLIFIGVVV